MGNYVQRLNSIKNSKSLLENHNEISRFEHESYHNERYQKIIKKCQGIDEGTFLIDLNISTIRNKYNNTNQFVKAQD